MELLLACRHLCPKSFALLCLAHGSGAVHKKRVTCTELSKETISALPLTVPVLIDNDKITDMRDIIMKIASVDSALTSSEMSDEWISVCVNHGLQILDITLVQKLSEELLSRTFVGSGIHVTPSDFIVFASMQKWIATCEASALQNCVALIRWYNYMQNQPGIRDLVEMMDLVKRYEEGKESKQMSTSPASTKKKEGPKTMDSKSGNSQRLGQEVQGDKKSSSETSSVRPLQDPTRLQIKVGMISRVWPHPNADALYCEEVDVGEAQPRQIASGLRNFVPLEKMEGSYVLVLANMKVKNLRGFPSHGMLLCASNMEHTAVELMHPPPGSKPGDLIVFDGLTGEADEVLSTKKGHEALPSILEHLRTDEKCIGHWKGHKMIHTSICGGCFCDSITRGLIS